MDIATLTTFFVWCTNLSVGILITWAVVFAAAPDFVYRTQTRWFPVPRETFNVIVFSVLAGFRVLFVVFALGPYVALLIVG
jgi:hypothetical protein